MELREALEAAIDSAPETEPVEPAAEPVETSKTHETESEKETRERDEQGRFKAKEASQEAAEGDEPPPAEASTEGEQTPSEPAKEPKPRPSSWKKELWEKYDSLPEDVQDYILQREEEARRGVGMYRQKAEFAEKLEQEFVPYRDLMQRLNTTPETVVRSLMNTAAILYDGDRATKAALIQKLAIDHGLTSEDFAQAANGGMQAVTAHQQALQYKAELERIKAQQQMSEEQQTLSIIEEFRSTHPHFDAVRDDMAMLVQAGKATDWQDAYDKALKLSDLAPAQQPPARDRHQAARAAKAAAVSPRSTTATVTRTNPQDRRSAIEALVDQHLNESRV